jgi:hypothetical protein
MHGSIDWLLGFDKRPRRTLARSPRAVPWENALPWAVVMISQTVVADDRERASACAKAVDASTSRGVGISITVKIPNACGWCGVGRRRSGRPSGVRTKPSNHSMPKPNACAVSVSLLRHKRRSRLRLGRRVVTQQKFFRRLPCATGQGVMSRFRRRAAARHATAAPLAVKPLAGCSIVNASGDAVALSKAAAHGSRSTRPHEHGGPDSNTTQPGRCRHGHRPRDQVHRPRRSAVDRLARQAP